MNVCEAVTSLLIIKWLARSLAPLRLTDTRHPFHTRVSSPILFKVARYIYLYTFVHTFPIISSFTYSIRRDARSFGDRRFPPTFSQTFNVSQLLKLREYFKPVSVSVERENVEISNFLSRSCIKLWKNSNQDTLESLSIETYPKGNFQPAFFHKFIDKLDRSFDSTSFQQGIFHVRIHGLRVSTCRIVHFFASLCFAWKGAGWFKAISQKYDLAARLYMIYERWDPYNSETLRRVYGELIKSLHPTNR